MTGEWKEGENAETLLKMDDEDEDLYGDFEDLETGKKYKAPEKQEDSKEDKVDEGEVKFCFSIWNSVSKFENLFLKQNYSK